MNFDAKVEIDENSDIEYFQVPPHHELSETNAMYDFRMVSKISGDDSVSYNNSVQRI